MSAQQSGKIDMCQVIAYDFSINKEIGKYLDSVGFTPLGTEYNTLAIIGPQSSGKSTLLNILFDTNFEVMVSTAHRQQTTKGVWMAGHKGRKVLVFDCEGTDSKNRSEDDRGKFEHSSSLFALAMSDVLIINMWTKDVGRYTASNYGVLKIVFEMNLKLFQQECAKSILIILRDFDPKSNQQSAIEKLIMDDINKIWSEIKKPDKYKDSNPKNFFTFEFYPMSHKIYLPEKFKEDAQKLRNRLDKENKEFLFKHTQHIKNVPADGLEQYINQLWTDILNEKELNIPSQREMLANYRTTQIKKEVLEKFEEDVNKIKDECKKSKVKDFKEKCIQLKNTIVGEFEKLVSNYDEKIASAKKLELENELGDLLDSSFKNQIHRLIPIIQKYMRKELDYKLNKSDVVIESYLDIAEKVKKDYLKQMLQKINELKAFDQWKVTDKDYDTTFDEIIESQKQKCLDNKIKDITKTLIEEMEEIYLPTIEEKKSKFWNSYRLKYLEFLFYKVLPLKKYLEESYNLTQDEVKELLNKIQIDVYEGTHKLMLQNMKSTSSMLKELFKKDFWYDPSTNQMRNWRALEQDKIEDMFRNLKNELTQLLESFKQFEILKNPLERIDFETMQVFQEDEVAEKIAELQDVTYESLLKPAEINLYKKRFIIDISNMFDDATRRHEGFDIKNMPIWYYILIVFFGYDDLFRLLKNPYALTLVLLIGSIYFSLKKLNKLSLIKDIYYNIEDKAVLLQKSIAGFIKRKLNRY